MPYPFQDLWREYEEGNYADLDLADWLYRVFETARVNEMSVPFCVRVSSDIRRLTASYAGSLDELLWRCSEVLTRKRHEQIPLYPDLEVQLKRHLQGG
jgi:hypothetical protein